MRNIGNLHLIIITSITIILLLNGCTTNDQEKIDLIYGEWKVEDLKQTSVNDVEGTLLTKEYYIEFNIENCGATYDLDRDTLNAIKWGYQWADGIDRFMISTQLENLFGSSDFSISNLYEVRKLEEDKFLLTQQVVRVLNDTTFVTNWDLNLTR